MFLLITIGCTLAFLSFIIWFGGSDLDDFPGSDHNHYDTKFTPTPLKDKYLGVFTPCQRKKLQKKMKPLKKLPTITEEDELAGEVKGAKIIGNDHDIENPAQ